MGRAISAVVGIVLLILAFAMLVVAISVAGEGLGFMEYGQFLVLAAILWGASKFFRKKPH